MLAVDPSLYPEIEGSTDSEVFFYLALTFGLEDDPPKAVQDAVGVIEATGRRHGVEHPIQMTVATTNGESIWAFRYSSEGRSRSLFFSTDLKTMKMLYPDNARFQQLDEESRLIVSEPLVSLVGAWNEVPESSWGVVQPGQDELHRSPRPSWRCRSPRRACISFSRATHGEDKQCRLLAPAGSEMGSSASVTDTAPAPVPRPLWKRLLKPALVTAALVVVFGWLLPQFIDYEEVWEALTLLDAWEVVVLLGLGLARVPTEALMYRAFLPGLGLWRGSEAYLSSNFAGQLLPPPSASVVQYGYFLGGGYAPDAAGVAALGSFIFPTIGRFLLPLVALVLLLVTDEASGSVVLAGALSLVVTAVAGIAGYVFLRGEGSARWLGAKVQRPLSWILLKFKRDAIEDGAGKAAELRTQALAVLREGWALGSVGVAANLLLTYLILLASLRFVGVSSAELSAADAFAAFAIAFWAGRCSRSQAAVLGSSTRS